VDVIELMAVGPVEGEVMEYLEEILHKRFKLEMRTAAALASPEFAYDSRRSQYDSTRILREALERISGDAVRLLAVTGADLFLPMLSFVFGQAQLNGRVALISLARLRQEFYGLPPDRPLLLRRAAKEALHELGHSLGLAHCTAPTCAMSLSTNIQQVDAKNHEYCPGCNALIAERLASIRVRASLAQHEEDRP